MGLFAGQVVPFRFDNFFERFRHIGIVWRNQSRFELDAQLLQIFGIQAEIVFTQRAHADQVEVTAKKVISFLPGSRKNEIKKHLPVMKRAKQILRSHLPDYSFRIIRPPHIEPSFYTHFSPDMDVVDHAPQTLQESSFIIASSGTATVEIAILEVPFLVIYKVNPLTWHIAKRLVDVPFISMVNILARRKICTELLQENANATTIAQETVAYLNNPEKYAALKKDLEQIKEVLSPYGATTSFAQFIGKYLGLAR